MVPETATKTLQALAEDRIPHTEEIVNLIVKTLKRHAHRTISRATAKLLYEAIIEHIITQTLAKQGAFRLPSGWGSFYFKLLGQDAKPRKLPNGTLVERKPKGMVRYQQGAIVRQLANTQTPTEYKRTRPRRSAVIEAVGEGVNLAEDLNADEGPSV